MRFKEYKIYNTISKTSKENKLEVSSNRLFDFSLLSDLNITDIEKEIIKDTALKYVTFSNKREFYGKMIDQFTACDGIALFHVQKVFSEKTGTLKYGIFTLARIEHYSKSRESVYENNYGVIETMKENGYNEPITDIEI